MAQAQPEKKEEAREMEELIVKGGDQAGNVGFRFNAQAPEFVPRSMEMLGDLRSR